MTNHPNRNRKDAMARELLVWAFRLKDSLEYYIRIDSKIGDHESARSKILTLNMVNDTIKRAAAIGITAP